MVLNGREALAGAVEDLGATQGDALLLDVGMGAQGLGTRMD